jgi:RES domain-containing protein
MVYASTSLALAAIELFVHLEPNQAPRDLVSIAAELPEDEPGRRWEREALPEEWSSDELGLPRAKGDAWIRSQESLAVHVPSVPIPLEWNVLINPLHPRMHELSIKAADSFHFDARMFQGR